MYWVWGANIYLLVDDDLTLVDIGFFGRVEQILRKITQPDFLPSDIARIIITHHHADHVGSLTVLKKDTQAEVILILLMLRILTAGCRSQGRQDHSGFARHWLLYIGYGLLLRRRWTRQLMMAMNCQCLAASRFCTHRGIRPEASACICKTGGWSLPAM